MFNYFNPKKAASQIVNFIQEEVKKAGFQKTVIGLSGGIDSTVSTYLAVRALGKENVLVAFLPYKNLYPQNLLDAKLVSQKLQIPAKNIFEINIGSICEEFFKTDSKVNNSRKGSIMARTRMVLLFDLAKKHQALVLGTENKSEYLLGYFTRFGDSASDIEPIRHLYKTEVRLLAKYLSVPDKIISKTPTAGFWPGQTDEGQLGFTYQQTDQILYLLFDKKLTKSQVIQQNHAKDLVEKIESRVKRNAFMHNSSKSLKNPS